jgi:hypothetical protein
MAKATRILATNCCVCRRDLTDAKSVELGIGPICRKKYGSADIETTDEMRRRALGALATSGLEPHVIKAVLERGKDARAVCNWLVYWASANYTNKAVVLACTPIIRLLGYTTLADKLETDRSAVVLTTTDDGKWVLVKSPRCEMFMAGVRRLGGRMVRHETSMRFKGWAVPSDAATKASLALLLGVSYPDEHCHANGETYVMAAASWKSFMASLPAKPAPKVAPAPPKATVTLEDKGRFFVLHTPYNPAFVAAIRNVRGRRYEGGDANSFPSARRDRVADLVQQHYGVTL